MRKEYKFELIQRRFTVMDEMGNLEFLVFRRGEILPVALIKLTPVKVKVKNFKGKEAEMQELKNAFKQFSGCSIWATSKIFIKRIKNEKY